MSAFSRLDLVGSEPPRLDQKPTVCEAVQPDARPPAAPGGLGEHQSLKRGKAPFPFGWPHREPFDRRRHGKSQLGAAPQPDMRPRRGDDLDFESLVASQLPGRGTVAGKLHRAIGQRPCGMEAISRHWPPASHTKMHAGPIDHHTDATVGTNVGHPERQHAEVQPRRGFHLDGTCGMMRRGSVERHAKSRPRPTIYNKRLEHQRPKEFGPWTHSARQMRPKEFDPWPRVFNLWNPRRDTDKLKTCRHGGRGTRTS